MHIICIIHIQLHVNLRIRVCSDAASHPPLPFHEAPMTELPQLVETRAAASHVPSATPPSAQEPAVLDTIEPGRRTGPIVAVLAITGVVVSLAQSLVVPIITELPTIFQTDASNTSWIITITLLVGAITTPVVGRLGDMFGKKRMLLIALAPFAIGSALAALSGYSGDLTTMIIGRGLQGLGTGMVPLGISLLHDVLPKDKAGGAIALMSGTMGIGGALGLVIAAAVTQYSDWKVLFWGTAVVAVLAFFTILFAIPVHDPKLSGPRSFDWVGLIGLAVGLTALLLGISKGAEWGWGSPLTIGAFVVGVIVLLGWGWFEIAGSAHPLVDLRTTAKPVVLLTNLASILVGFGMYSVNLVLPQLMEYPQELGFGLGQSMLGMGLWMAPAGIAMMALSPVGAALTRRTNAKVTLTAGAVIIAIGYGLAAIVLATIGNRELGAVADQSQIVWTLILFALSTLVAFSGVGFAFGAMPALILGAVPANEKAAANGFNSLMRSLGTTSSAAIIAAIIAGMTQELPNPAGGTVTVPTIDGFLVALAAGCAAALVAAIIAACIPRKQIGAVAAGNGH